MNSRLFGVVAALLACVSAHAQFTSSVVTDSNGLMWANTIGIDVGWFPSGGPDTAQGWVAGLNANKYGGYDDWTLATGDGSAAPNTTTNQLGELFYTNCGNSPGSFTSLNNPGKNCSALSSLQSVINADNVPTAGIGLDLIISATPFHQLDDFEQLGYWVYGISGGGQGATTNDTVVFGLVGRGDALAVRDVTQAPEIDANSAAAGLTLLLGTLLVIGSRRKSVDNSSVRSISTQG
jgi:hypothetical protein